MARKDDDFGSPAKYDPSFKGPLERRSCTDVLCLLLFIIFLVCWAVIGFLALTKGNISVLINPKDSNGNICGVDSDVIDRPYLVFFDLTKCINPKVLTSGCPTKQVCVSQCPEAIFNFNINASTYSYDKNYMICEGGVQPETYDTAATLVNQLKCAEWYLPSNSVLNRCIPTLHNLDSETILQMTGYNITAVETAIKNVKLLAAAGEISANIISDYTTTWWKILIGLGIAVLVCILYIAIMRWTAGVMIWLSIIGVIALLGLSVYITVDNYLYYKNSNDSPSNFLTQYISTKNVWLVLAIIASAVLVIILLILLVLRNRICLAIVLVKESSKAVSSVTASLFFPIFPWIIQIAVIVYGLGVGLFLLTLGDAQYEIRNMDSSCVCTGNASTYTNGSECKPATFASYCNTTECSDASCYFVGINSPSYINVFHAINILCFFWSAFFVSAFGEMVLASTFATWYWTFQKSRVPFFTVTVSLFRTCRYHLGTLAFGSLIISICRIIRVILEYIDQQLKKYDNVVTRAIMCCLKCFFWCLEKFLKFINRNAYIMCAVYGYNFCTSARKAFGLLMRNIVRVVVLDKVTDFLFFLSKLLLGAGVGCVAYLYFIKEDDSSLNYPLVPVLTIAIGTYFIATLFFTVFTMAVDTIFLCFLEDCERNDGSREKPYFMSKQLMSIFGGKNKIY